MSGECVGGVTRLYEYKVRDTMKERRGKSLETLLFPVLEGTF